MKENVISGSDDHTVKVQQLDYACYIYLGAVEQELTNHHLVIHVFAIVELILLFVSTVLKWHS